MANRLDDTGLSYLWLKIKQKLSDKVNTSSVGAANGVASLGNDGKVPASQLPTDNNTTYTLTQDVSDGHIITLTPSVGQPTVITIPDENTMYSVMTGATDSQDGTSGLVPAPTSEDYEKFLTGDGTWTAGSRPMVVLSYGSSTWQDFIDAYNKNVIVYCRASSNSNPATGAQTRMAFMAYVNANPPTEVEFQYYRSVSSHSQAQQGDQVYIYKLTSANGGKWTVTTRESYTRITAGTNMSESYANGVLTLNSTLENKSAAHDGTDISLVTTGEKYVWNNKADRDETATQNNFASFDSNGNPVDSGHKHSDYLTVSLKGVANGLAELDATGKVPSTQLPSYVDDVLEYDSVSNFPSTGESGKIYVAKDTNKTYRWSGTAYVEISPSIALGETSSTAYRGDRGKTAYDHASAKGSAFASGLYKITTNSEGHVTSATAVAKSDITGLGIPGSDTNTHRPIQVNGTEVLGDNTTALNLKAGSNVSVTNDSGMVTISATDTTYSDATTSASGLMSSGDKTKLNGIATGAEVNQNAFSNVAVGSTTIAADAKTDTLTLVAGSNITITPDATNDKITIAATDTAVRVYRQTSGYNNDYPLIASRTLTVGTAGTDSSYADVYGVIGNTNYPTVNPSTGLVKFKGLTVTDKITGSISGDAGTVNGHTVGTNVPSFTSSDAGKFLTIGSNGSIVATTMVAWAGGNY